jgi:hypothetical protein
VQCVRVGAGCRVQGYTVCKGVGCRVQGAGVQECRGCRVQGAWCMGTGAQECSGVCSISSLTSHAQLPSRPP